ncbi:MAG: hypothetical protein SPL30_03310 [Succinivibrio sp.]|jgi:hypothetical protein|nr:hypothetical protein [Succinivibrio sp.]
MMKKTICATAAALAAALALTAFAADEKPQSQQPQASAPAPDIKADVRDLKEGPQEQRPDVQNTDPREGYADCNCPCRGGDYAPDFRRGDADAWRRGPGPDAYGPRHFRDDHFYRDEPRMRDDHHDDYYTRDDRYERGFRDDPRYGGRYDRPLPRRGYDDDYSYAPRRMRGRDDYSPRGLRDDRADRDGYFHGPREFSDRYDAPRPYSDRDVDPRLDRSRERSDR